MQFHQSTSFSPMSAIGYHTKIKTKTSFILIVSLCLFLFSCSSATNKAPDTDNSSQEDVSNKQDLKAMSDEIIALVEPDLAEAPNQEDKHQTNIESTNKLATEKNKNLYLEQQSQLMVNVSKELIKSYQSAVTAMEKEQWQFANKLFDQVISSHPQLSGAYVNKAIIAMAQNKMIIAQFQIDKALKVNKNNPYAYNIQGQLARLKGDFVKAEQSYLKALTIWPNFAQVHWNLAVLLELYRGRYFDAKVYYLSFLQLKPEDEKVKRSIAGLDIKIARARKE